MQNIKVEKSLNFWVLISVKWKAEACVGVRSCSNSDLQSRIIYPKNPNEPHHLVGCSSRQEASLFWIAVFCPAIYLSNSVVNSRLLFLFFFFEVCVLGKPSLPWNFDVKIRYPCRVVDFCQSQSWFAFLVWGTDLPQFRVWKGLKWYKTIQNDGKGLKTRGKVGKAMKRCSTGMTLI